MADNGRVKTSVFYKELKDMRKEMGQELKEIRKDISGYHVDMAALTERVNTHRKEIDIQRKRSNVYDILNSVGVIIAIGWATITGNK